MQTLLDASDSGLQEQVNGGLARASLLLLLCSSFPEACRSLCRDCRGACRGVAQVLEMLKALLDPDTLEASAEKDKFVELFYDKHVGVLLTALVAAGEATGGAPQPSANTGACMRELRSQQWLPGVQGTEPASCCDEARRPARLPCCHAQSTPPPSVLSPRPLPQWACWWTCCASAWCPTRTA